MNTDGFAGDILYITHRVPHPPDKGDRIRTWNILRYLSGHMNSESTRVNGGQQPLHPLTRGGSLVQPLHPLTRGGSLGDSHIVDLVCLADEPVSPESREALQRLCRHVEIVPHAGWARWLRGLGSAARGRSLSEGVFWSPELARRIGELTARYSYRLVLTSASSLGPYLEVPGLARVPAIVDLMDVDSQKWRDYASRAWGWRSWLYAFEAGRVERLERRLAERVQALLVVSAVEAELFRRFCPDGPIQVVPNGVDLDYFTPQPVAEEQGCVFVGALDYRPNVDAAVWFCKEVWPALRRRHPQARFRLVGRQPTPAVRQLGRIEGVDVVGQVPDVRPYVASAAVVVAPLRIARGIQNKVLEAMAMSKAVVASPEALQGLQGRAVPVVRAETVEDWITAVGQLLEDAQTRQTLSESARRFVQMHHSWQQALVGLLERAGPRQGLEPAEELAVTTGQSLNRPVS